MHEGHRERMRERYLQNGIGAFAPHEVLEMLLFFTQPRVNTNESAHALLKTFHSFSGVLDADYESLCRVQGIGKSSALLICMLKDCINLYTKSKWEKRPQLQTAMEVGAYAMDVIGEQTDEGFYLLCLDSSRFVTAFKKIADGTAYRAFVDVRKVVECALQYHAYQIVLVHNHPFGSIEPSDSDIALTDRLVKTLHEIDIPVIDHIIVGDGCFFSMAAHQMI